MLHALAGARYPRRAWSRPAMSEPLDVEHVRALLRLMQEARELRRDTQARRRHLLAGLCRIVGGDTAGLVDFPAAPRKGTSGHNLVTVGFSEIEGQEAFSIYNSDQGSLRNAAL